MKISKFIAAATIAFAIAGPAQATPLSFIVKAPEFTSISGSFENGARITGSISFDSSMLDASGSGYVDTNSNNINPGVTWRFTDGLNNFDNQNTTWNFDIGLLVANYKPVAWNIDTTFGITPWGDIFLSNGGANVSYYNYDWAVGAPASASDWTVTGLAEVPEPGSLALVGLGLLGAAALRRRKKSQPTILSE